MTFPLLATKTYLPNLMPNIGQSTLDWLATLPARAFACYPALGELNAALEQTKVRSPQ